MDAKCPDGDSELERNKMCLQATLISLAACQKNTVLLTCISGFFTKIWLAELIWKLLLGVKL